MLDIKYIRENPDAVAKGIKSKGVDIDIDSLLKLDQERMKLLKEVEVLRAEQNIITEEIGKLGDGDERSKKIREMKEFKTGLKTKENALTTSKKRFENLLRELPNLPLDGVPVGDESKNKVLKKVGEPRTFDFDIRDHIKLGKTLNIIDIERAAKVSGSRFAYLLGKGALLEFALIRFAMERLTREGFTAVIPPALIRQEITQGLGYWQSGGNENFYLVKDYQLDKERKEKELNLYLIGTGEHALVPMYKDEILNEKDLPLKYAAFSPCFRRESGSYGKDVHGILRVHQFDKIEMVSFVKPKDDEKERTKFLEISESLTAELELPYQTVKLASSDIAFPTAETIDIETWIPSEEKYRETHSISTTTDFQARRFGIRYRKSGKDIEFVHILNGTAIAIQRTIIALLENHQQKDGTVTIPRALRPYTGFDIID